MQLIEVAKIKTNDGTVYCFVYPLNDTSRTDMNQVNRPLIAVRIFCTFRNPITVSIIDEPFHGTWMYTANSTRGHPFKLTVPLAKCNRSKYAFASRVVPVWNHLPVSVVICKSVSAFERILREVDLSKFLFVSYSNNC